MSLRTATASIVVASAILFSTPAAAEAKFIAWHGKAQALEGEGGEMEEVDGIQFWSNGDPPRYFVLVGYINDTRLSTGLIGKMRVKGRTKEIAEVARANGGNAVMLVDANTATKGYIQNYQGSSNRIGSRTSGNASSFGTAVQNESTRYAVLKYVDAPANAPTEPSQTTAPTGAASVTSPVLPNVLLEETE